MSKIAVAVFNRKGGVGKSTLSVILAEIALVRHNSVLAVDLDPSHNFTDALNFLQNYFRDSLRIKSNLKDSDANAKEDWIIIDCPPLMGKESDAAMKFADIMVVPVRPDFFSLSSLPVTYSKAGDFDKDRVQLPLVKIGYDNSAMTRIANQIITDSNYPVAADIAMHKKIPYNITLGHIWSTGLTAAARNPYENLFEKIELAGEKLSAGATVSEIGDVWAKEAD
ncbi:MAG: ParA family protein [Synergistaceae bacterium]|nr:ParA family protein [Synergistaceae bacterium]